MAYNEALDFLDEVLDPHEFSLIDSLPSLREEEQAPSVIFDALDSNIGESNAENSNATGKRRKMTKSKSGKNKARDERRFVLMRLQEEVAQLQFTLGQLQSVQGKRSCSSKEPRETESGVPRVWKGICSRQFAGRLKVERENLRLKQQAENDQRLLKSVEKLLYKRRAQKYVDNGIDMLTRRTDIPEGYIERMTAFLFEELSTGVERLYRQVGGEIEEIGSVPVFGRPLLPGGVKRTGKKFFDRRLLPFNMQATGEAWWLNWHNHRGRPVQENAGDVVSESFGVEMNDFKANSTVTSFGQQILWRQVEADRIVFVWNSYMEPVAFENERISGMYFLEQCYVLIEPGEDEGSSCMSTCYIITPYVLNPELQDDPKACALIDFFVGAVCSTIKLRGETVEDLLLEKALQKYSFG